MVSESVSSKGISANISSKGSRAKLSVRSGNPNFLQNVKRANERRAPAAIVDYEKIIQESNTVLIIETKLMAIQELFDEKLQKVKEDLRLHVLEFENSMDRIYESQTVVRREILDEMTEKNLELRDFVLMNSDRVVDICKDIIA